MADKPWKQFERESAALIGGKRFWANSGEAIDVEGPKVVGQCKEVKTLSLQALNNLVVVAEEQAEAKGKIGHVFTKLRNGRGKKTLPLVVMSFEAYRRLTGDDAGWLDRQIQAAPKEMESWPVWMKAEYERRRQTGSE